MSNFSTLKCKFYPREKVKFFLETNKILALFSREHLTNPSLNPFLPKNALTFLS